MTTRRGKCKLATGWMTLYPNNRPHALWRTKWDAKQGLYGCRRGAYRIIRWKELPPKRKGKR